MANFTGSLGTGVGVAIFGSDNGVNGAAAAPVTANNGDIGLTPASQLCCRQATPKFFWMVSSSE